MSNKSWMTTVGVASAMSLTMACGGDDADQGPNYEQMMVEVVEQPPQEVVVGEAAELRAVLLDEDGEVVVLEQELDEETVWAWEADGVEATTMEDGEAHFSVEMMELVEGVQIEVSLEIEDRELGRSSVETDPFDVVVGPADGEESMIEVSDGVADGVTPATVEITLRDAMGYGVEGIVPELEWEAEGIETSGCEESDDEGRSICGLYAIEVMETDVSMVAPVESEALEIQFVDCNEDGEPFGGGDGTSESPFRLCAPHHLQPEELSNEEGENNYRLYSDIDMGDWAEEVEPFGSQDFDGVFDGAGQEIQNLELSASGEGTWAGFFPSLQESGVVTDLSLKDWVIESESGAGMVTTTNYGLINEVSLSGTVTAQGRAGMVAARNLGVVQNVSIEDATVTSTDGGFVGGVVGGTDDGGTVENAMVEADVEGNSLVGGIAGALAGDDDWIEDVHFQGSVSGDNRVGGAVGRNGGIVRDATAIAGVDGDVRVGGLVGKNWGLVERSMADATVSGNRRVGGLVGTMFEAVATVPLEIRESYALGEVEDRDGNGSSFWGGLLGNINGGSVVDSYAAVTVDASGEHRGALIGLQFDSEVESSYYDSDVDVLGQSDGGQGLSSADFGDADSFSGWDFDEVWTIGEAADGVDRPIFEE